MSDLDRNGLDYRQELLEIERERRTSAQGAASSRLKTARRAGLMLLGFAAAVLLVALVLFVPVFLAEISRVEMLVHDGWPEKAGAFAGRMKDLLVGAIVVATAIVSFILSFFIAPFEPRFLTAYHYADFERQALGVRRKRERRRGDSLENPGRNAHVRSL